MTDETFAKVLGAIEHTRFFRFTTEEAQVWWMTLAPLEDEPALQATVEILRTVEDRITPSHIWNLAKEFERDRPTQPALDWPAVSDEKRMENLGRLAAMGRDLTNKKGMPT